jgi:hypothetical protein
MLLLNSISSIENDFLHNQRHCNNYMLLSGDASASINNRVAAIDEKIKGDRNIP